MRLVVMFHRLGPYHHARLKATDRVRPVIALELSARDRTYAWDEVEGATEFEKQTVFESADSETVASGRVRGAVMERLDAIGPDVLAVPGIYDKGALSGLYWCQKNDVPCLVMADSTERDLRRNRLKEWIKGRLVRCFSAALVAGQPQVDYVCKLGLPRDRVFTGYDAVDNAYFLKRTEAVRDRAEHFRKAHNLPERFFLSTNRFVEKKNLLRLVEAYAEYREKAEAPWDLVLLGDGELMPQVKQRVAELNLRNHVLLPGFKQYDEIPVYYALASGYVQASTSEQWGLVVNEAMASGLPVLVSHLCGCAEDLVREGSNGFTFDPFDISDMAEKMVRLSSDECDREQMGTTSQETISAWSCENFAANLWRAAELSAGNPVRGGRPLQRILPRAILSYR